jgi:hypothetical protein
VMRATPERLQFGRDDRREQNAHINA